MESNRLVSIVVPMYNAEKYVERCINSLLRQTYANIEILVINDGSKDGSLEIVNRLEAHDERIITISTKNTGVSHARNIGLDRAKGEYITFVDSDDYVEDNYIEELAALIENHSDISVVGYDRRNPDESLIGVCTYDNCSCMFGDKDILQPFSKFFSGGILSKMYRRDIVDGIRFDEGLRIGEDRLFWIQCVLKAKNINLKGASLYHYVIHSDSAMKKRNAMDLYNNFVSCIRCLEVINNVSLKAQYRLLTEIAAEECIENIDHYDESIQHELISFRRKNGIYKFFPPMNFLHYYMTVKNMK